MRDLSTLLKNIYMTISIPLFLLLMSSVDFFVKKRNGANQPVEWNKIRIFLQHLMSIPEKCNGINIDYVEKLIKQSWGSHMNTSDIPTMVAEQCSALNIKHHHYGLIAGRAVISNLHKETSPSFSETVKKLSQYLNKKFIQFVENNTFELENIIVHERDYQYDIFAIKTLMRSYLLKKNQVIVERPQYMLMRVAIALALRDEKPSITFIRETYNAMSTLKYTHATPTLFHSGFKKQQLASCYLATMQSDSIGGIFNTLKQCALISKGAGGIGLSISNIRSTGSEIKGTNGISNGIIPMLKVFNDTSRYIDQGGGKRKGSFAIFLEPHHPDLIEFLQLKKNNGVESERARDLFYGLWISDLFMQRVENGQMWSFFCPNIAKKLQDAVGEDYKTLYNQYEQEGKALKSMPARKVWEHILDSQIETGTPYLLYKDACNLKSNQQHLGTIRGSNLCCEIIEYTASDEIAVCTLASIALPKCVSGNTFSFPKLEQVVRMIVRNLNRAIDVNYYPLPEAKKSNMLHRNMGIGVQGLADVFQILKIPYESVEAQTINKNIFEAIYFYALSESVEEAKKYGYHPSFPNSPASQGILQFDMWNVEPSKKYDWQKLKLSIKTFGLRNSLLIAPMPTASTANILMNTESFEPRTSNLYVRRVLAGEYIIVNKYLQEDLIKRNLWNDSLIENLIKNRGSIQHINLPQNVKDIYKTVWEIKQRSIINMAASRGPFIDQSQSLNLYVENPQKSVLTSMHFYAWKKGLKTGQYYLRTQPKARPIQYTVKAEQACTWKPKNNVEDDDDGDCIMCSS